MRVREMSFTSKTITFLNNGLIFIFLVFYLQELDWNCFWLSFKCHCLKPTRHGSFSQLFITSDVDSLFLFSQWHYFRQIHVYRLHDCWLSFGMKWTETELWQTLKGFIPYWVFKLCLCFLAFGHPLSIIEKQLIV